MLDRYSEIELQALVTEREAMIAANQERLSLGEAIAYDYNHFAYLASQIRELEKNLKKKVG
jgi:hypothetical protein